MVRNAKNIGKAVAATKCIYRPLSLYTICDDELELEPSAVLSIYYNTMSCIVHVEYGRNMNTPNDFVTFFSYEKMLENINSKSNQ